MLFYITYQQPHVAELPNQKLKHFCKYGRKKNKKNLLDLFHDFETKIYFPGNIDVYNAAISKSGGTDFNLQVIEISILCLNIFLHISMTIVFVYILHLFTRL